MGCGEEDLEKKARQFGWREVVGGLAITAGVFGGMFYVAHHFYNRGYDIGVEEAKEEAPKVEVEVRSTPVKDAFARVGNYSFSATNCGAVNETLYVSTPSAAYYIQDVDGLVEEGSRTWETKHDGFADILSVSGYVLIRERDYEVNKGFFDEADALLKEAKEKLY